jgi:hypothetical protein
VSGPVLLDTGPLVSFLSGEQEHSEWVIAQWKRLRPPLLTCEPVLTETAFLLKRGGADADPVFELLERGPVNQCVSRSPAGGASKGKRGK